MGNEGLKIGASYTTKPLDGYNVNGMNFVISESLRDMVDVKVGDDGTAGGKRVEAVNR